jgi:hypothetical protein
MMQIFIAVFFFFGKALRCLLLQLLRFLQLCWNEKSTGFLKVLGQYCRQIIEEIIGFLIQNSSEELLIKSGTKRANRSLDILDHPSKKLHPIHRFQLKTLKIEFFKNFPQKAAKPMHCQVKLKLKTI